MSRRCTTHHEACACREEAHRNEIALLAAEIAALRECVKAADDMRDRSTTYRGLTQSIDRYDAARAKVSP